MTEDDLKEINALLANTTAGRWLKVEPCEGAPATSVISEEHRRVASCETEGDAAFIAAAPLIVERLVCALQAAFAREDMLSLRARITTLEAMKGMSEHATNAYELGRRAVACKHWRWMPGMLLFPHVEDCECCEDRNFPRRAARLPAVFATDLDVPDLSDPATLGCLLHLVREAYSDELIFIVYDSGYWFVENQHGLMAQKNTEAEALVRVLESAP